jgi:phytoene desaturase
MARKKKIAVIGAGLGGMSAAARLAHAGFDVDLFEQNEIPGGKANEFYDNGFRFDAGPSLLTMPFVLRELFEDLGEKIEDYIELTRLNIICKYFWDDGTILNAFDDVDKFAKEIECKTNDLAKSVLKYLKYSQKIYELTADLFLFNSISDFKNIFSVRSLNTLFQLHKIDLFRTMHEANKSFFKDEKTIQLFDRYATYNGSSPFKAPATLNIIQHVEYNLGAFVSKKGMYSVADAVYKLALKNGVKFFFNSKVEKINHAQRKISGLEILSNGKIKIKNYDAVISNADVSFTYDKLLDVKEENPVKIKTLEPSSSAVVFYWGIKGTHKELDVHNILFSNNYEKEFHDIFNLKICGDDPTIYIYISSKFNASDAPEECENWFVMINAPVDYGQDWHKEKIRLKEIIVHKIKSVLKIDIADKIISEKIITPEDLEMSTSSERGSIYGISSNNKYAAFMREKNKSRKYNGLYFCGGSAHPGGGIPLVLLSGKITADLVTRHQND